MTPRLFRSSGALLGAVVFCLLVGSAHVAQAQVLGTTNSMPPGAPASGTAPAAIYAPVRVESGARWQSLTPAQRDALAPLEKEWPTIDPARKQKWLSIAGRFSTLPPQERARISERMTEWARLTPTERGEVRLRYQEARQVPAPDRSARWAAYQKLPPDEKKQFAARAASSAAPAIAPKHDAGREPLQGKANVVPNPALAQPPRPVAPTVVQASRGATTHLITRPTSPPAHQQTGMPKIAATPEFVNRSTLLPRRGPQAAAITPVGVSLKPIAPAVPRPAPVAAPLTAPAKASEPALSR